MPSSHGPANATEGLPAAGDLATGSIGVEELRLRLELTADVAAVGAFEWDLQTNLLVWDDRMKALLAEDADLSPTLGSFLRRMLPADRPTVEAAATAAIETCGDLRADFRVINGAGATRWLTVRGRVRCDGSGKPLRMFGAVYDSSSVRADREQAARALDTMVTAYATIDQDWMVSYANEAARTLIAGRGEPVGRSAWELVPQLANPAISQLLHNVMAGQAPTTIEIPAPAFGGWFEVSVQPVANGIAILVSDVTPRRAAQNEAEAAAARVSLLAQAGTALMQRLPVTETVDAGLALLVPQLATAAMIYLRDGPERQLRMIGLRHEQPEVQADLRSLFERLPLGDDPSTATGRAVATGRTQVIGDLDGQLINRATTDPALRERLRAVSAVGVLAVPLVSRGESIGFIGLLGLNGRTPTGPDLVLIEDIASRIASAIDNAQIFGEVQQARQAAEEASGRLEFLAFVADALGSTLDAEQAAARLARMVVPRLADWSMVTLLDDDGRVDDIASSHYDASQQDLLDRYTAARRDSLLADPTLLNEVVGAGQPLFQLDGDTFAGRLEAAGDAQLLGELQAGSVTALPILARERTLGVISLYNTRERGTPTSLDMSLAREVTRRSGLVLDNARLYARSKSTAETLTRSLLTESVHPADLTVFNDYFPAIADAQVGGDWFDSFQTPDGTATLVIGDVMGHDTEAAALMAQLRTLVRAIAVDRQESPSSVLRRVDSAADTLGINTTATAILAQVINDGEPGGAHRFRWSNAGHPPPVLVLPDGRVTVLDSPPDLLLGLGSDFERSDHQIELPLAATVLMFTDGLVEGRAQPLDTGLSRLVRTAGPLAGLPLDQMCRQLLDVLRPTEGAEDDIALVAVRVGSQEGK